MNEVDLRLAEPDERGAVVVFSVGYPGSPTTYSYAAIEAKGLWYVTGFDGGASFTWQDLIGYFVRKDATVHELLRAATWETL